MLAGACSSNSSSSSAGSSGGASSSGSSASKDVTIGIVELNLSNPFFATLENATETNAKDNGWKVMKAEAKEPGDSETQVTAIENMINKGVKAIVVDPANSTALLGVVKKARDQGILVVTVNASLKPVNAADATFATDNKKAGELIGKWAKVAGPSKPNVAMLDFDLSDIPSHGRHYGFLKGMGLTDHSSEIVATALTKGTIETGQKKMESVLSSHPDINLVYAINEQTAHGAGIALKDAHPKHKIEMVSVDGSCKGVKDVKKGVLSATAMQFPKKMGKMADEAIKKFLKTGKKPAGGLTDSGSALITDHPAKGGPSHGSDWGAKHCWGG
jgi:fructose transport system substrate-binding protein